MSEAAKKQVATIIEHEEWKELRIVAFEEEKSISNYMRDLILKDLAKKKKQKEGK